MKKLVVLSSIFLLALAIACSGDDKKKAEDSATCKTPLNPNGDSELALLMRQLANWNDSLKSKLQERPLTAEEMQLPANIKTIFTAQRTDTTIDKVLFESMANFYLAQSEQFSKAGTAQADQVKYFNAMVQACITCHENFCHGPIKRINKMFVPVK